MPQLPAAPPVPVRSKSSPPRRTNYGHVLEFCGTRHGPEQALTLSNMSAGWSPQALPSGSADTPSCAPLREASWKHLLQSAKAEFSQGQCST